MPEDPPGRPEPRGAIRVSVTAAVTSFLVILPAELPDKTVLACLLLGSRYRPRYVFAGAAAAFVLQVTLAVTAGGLLSLLPRQPVQIAVAAMFVAGAVLVLRQHRPSDDEYLEEHRPRRTFLPVAATSFAVVFLAEFGDLTQILTVNLAARYHEPFGVGIGATAALWTAAGLAVLGGRGLLKVIPMKWLSRGAALVMLALAGTAAASLF